MAGKVSTYNSRQVVIAFGTHAATGLADDSFVTIEEKGEGVTSKTGCDGEIARAIDPNKQYIIKIALLQSSATSKWLRAKYKTDKATGDGMFPVLIKDLRGGQVFSADDAWVQKQPAFVRGKDTNNLEWTIETGEAEFDDN